MNKNRNKTDSTTVTNEHLKEVITEKIDTVISVPENTVSTTATISDLLSGKPIKAEGDSTEAEVIYDRKTGAVKLTGKTKARNDKVYKERTVSKDLKSSSSSRVKKDQKALVKEKETSYPMAEWWPVLLIILVIVLLIYMYYRFRQRRRQ